MKLIKFLILFAITFMLGVMASPAIGIAGITGGALAVAVSVMPRPSGIVQMALTVDIWQEYIAKNIYRQADWIKYSFNADQYVLAGKVVHIPQAGTGVGGKRNRKSLPATIKMRKDTDVTYALDEFSLDPMLIKNAETVELSYDKLDSVMGEQMDFLSEKVGDWFAYLWAAKNNVIRTSGSNIAAHLDGATGNRKSLTVADIRAAKKYLNKQETLKTERYGLLDSDMMDQLSADLSVTNKRDFSLLYDGKEGKIIKLEGFTLIERSVVATYDNTATPVLQLPFDDDLVARPGLATDNAGAIFWQKNAVEKAEGDVKEFYNEADATYYGDIFSALKRLGGRIRRADEKGVVSIIQSAA